MPFDPSPLAGLRALVRTFGLRRGLALAGRVVAGQARGLPFRDLPLPAGLSPDERRRERLSRRQIAPAVLLYRALRADASEDEALRGTAAVVEAAGIAFLRHTLGPLRRRDLAALDDAGRERFVRAKGARFFNATVRWDRVGADEVRFTVLACRFPALCEAVGAPELAPLFCAVDAAYFGSVEPDVVLERPRTIAEDAATCPFCLRFRADHSPR